MKRDKKLPGKRPLNRLFFRHYLVISALLITAIAIALWGTDIVMNRYVDQLDLRQIDGEGVYQYPFENISGELLDKFGGWFEVVDEEGRIIHVQGNKKDSLTRYAPGQIYAKIDLDRNDDTIIYHVYPVVGPGGEPYMLLWKIPAPIDKITIALVILVVLFAVLLLIALLVYTRYSVRQIKLPLQQLMEGIREMERFNYEQRLPYSTEKEFMDIQQAFNNMAERLLRTSEEKIAAETQKRNLLLHLSHDLKTPITSIYGYSQLLLDHVDIGEEEKSKYIRYIHDKSAYIASLVKNLFELAKLDDQQLELNREKVNITKWFQQLLVEFYPEIEAKGFTLEAEIPEEPLAVWIDKLHMNRVVTNLITNALLYNPSGTAIYAACERKDGCAVLWLGDNGVGVQEQIRDHVFDSFIRGVHAGKDSTGLGLAICQKIVTLHQGTIELLPDERYSTLFRIGLPCEDRRP